jgi:sulfur carrier protein
MKIILNNREEVLSGENLSVSEMLKIKKFSYKMRIVKINSLLIPREEYESTIIHDGDNVQMIYLMSGG